MDDDFELLDRWHGGDAGAGSALFRRHFDTLMRFFYAKAGRDVEDLVQTTLLQCVRASARFRRECSFRTFLFAVARKVLLAHYRKASSNDKIDPLVSSVSDLRTTPSEAVARDERATLVLAALQQIPVDYQLVLELHYWEGMEPRDLAKILELHPTTARTRLHRARGALRDALARIHPQQELSEAGIEALLTSPARG